MPRSTQPSDASSPIRLNWWLYALLWVPALLLGATNISLRPGVPFLGALRSSASTVAIGAVLGIAVWHITARIHWSDRSRVRFIATHVLFGVLYAALYAGLQYSQIAVFRGPELARTFMPPDTIGWTTLSGLYNYSMIAGISYALRYRHRVQQQQVALAQAEALAARAQLDVLRARLQPHFFSTRSTR